MVTIIDGSMFPKLTTVADNLVIPAFHEALTCLADHGLIKNPESLGIAVGPDATWEANRWNSGFNPDTPLDYIEGVAWWGPSGETCAMNAVRKIRASVRTGRDTRNLVSFEEKGDGDFVDVVPSVNEDGKCEWGDFPWAGAVWITSPEEPLTAQCYAVSGVKQGEDHVVASLFGNLRESEQLKMAHLAIFT